MVYPNPRARDHLPSQGVTYVNFRVTSGHTPSTAITGALKGGSSPRGRSRSNSSSQPPPTPPHNKPHSSIVEPDTHNKTPPPSRSGTGQHGATVVTSPPPQQRGGVREGATIKAPVPPLQMSSARRGGSGGGVIEEGASSWRVSSRGGASARRKQQQQEQQRRELGREWVEEGMGELHREDHLVVVTPLGSSAVCKGVEQQAGGGGGGGNSLAEVPEFAAHQTDAMIEKGMHGVVYSNGPLKTFAKVCLTLSCTRVFVSLFCIDTLSTFPFVPPTCTETRHTPEL
jgi:hypothetical protein